MESATQSIYIVSDGTGETASSIVKAGLVQYVDREVNITKYKNIRRAEQIESIVEEAFSNQALLVHTFVSPEMRTQILQLGSDKGLLCLDLLGPVLETLDDFLGKNQHSHRAGLLRNVDERYFKRIEAIEYTVKHDDGKTLSDLDLADIILVGLSRSSKTPLSIFLSHKGWKVANIPLVVGTPLPPELSEVDQRKVVALIIDSQSLARIRRKRLEKFGQDPGGEYASMAHIQREIDFASELYKKNKRWPVFDVTDRALEETAAEIIRIVSTRLGLPMDSVTHL